MDDSQRRAVARIPADRVSKTKIDLAMDMIGRAVAADIPRGVLLADSAYGESSVFRGRLRSLGLDYGLGIHGPTNVYLVDATGQTIGEPIGARQLGVELGLKAFRRYTWPWRDSDT